jgi:hypothetical protein
MRRKEMKTINLQFAVDQVKDDDRPSVIYMLVNASIVFVHQI